MRYSSRAIACFLGALQLSSTTAGEIFPFQASLKQGETQTTAASDTATVYVTVGDEHGVPITDLKREDFVLHENGVPQVILEVSRDTATPLLIGVLVDVSGSTRSESKRQEKLHEIRRFLDNSIHGPGGAYLAVFSDWLTLVTIVTNDRVTLDDGFSRIQAAGRKGSTALYDGLYSLSGADFHGRSGRKVLLALSDFEDNSSRHKLDETIAEAQRTATTIFPLVEMNDLEWSSKKLAHRAQKDAKQAAEETGGAAFEIDSVKQLVGALETIQAQLHNSYVLRYHTTGTSKENKPVPMKVAVLRARAVVFAPQGRVITAAK